MTLHTVFSQGGVVAYPTEACFGLGCDPENRAAVHKILALKNRSADKGLILIADQADRLNAYINWPEIDAYHRKQMEASWAPNAGRATTWLLPVLPATHSWLTGDFDTLAVRITHHPVARKLCADLGSALVSTSANPQGMAPATSAQAVRAYFADQVDWIIDAPIGEDLRPSQIIDAATGRVVRA